MTNSPVGGALSVSAERETKGQKEQLGKATKNPSGSAASLPGDSRVAPLMSEAGGCSPLERRQDPRSSLGTPMLPSARL